MQIAASCLAYINLIAFADGPCVSTSFSEMNVELRMNEHLTSRLLRYPFYGYASSHWAEHIRGPPELAFMDMVLSFLSQSNKLSSTLEANGHNFPNVVGLKAHYPSLHVTAFYGLRHVVDALLESGAPAGSHDFDLPTPLILASSQGHDDVAGLLLAQNDVDVNFQWHLGMTALLVAIEGTHTSVVRLLLQNRADVNIRCSQGTALMFAARTRNEPAVQLLMDSGAKFNGIDPPDEQLSIFEDVYDSSLAVLQIVLEKVGDPYLIDEIPVVTAVGRDRSQKDAEAKLRLLLEKGANVHDKDGQGRTAVHKAALYGNLRLLKFLVEVAGANVNKKDDEGRTPLFEAYSTDVITYLIDHGVNPEEEDLTGLTALDHVATFEKTYTGLVGERIRKRVECLRAYVNK